MLAFGSFFLFIAFLRKARNFPCFSFIRLIFSFLIAQKIFALKTRRTKIQTAVPCECLLGELRLSAGFPRSLRSLGMTMVGHPHPNGYIFEVFLYTQCATSKTEHEPQGGENMSAELDEKYENAWHSVA